ncbi:hypothetical protein DDI_2335 [Dickeya dianthicola RNS04.9]|nr:hypothetical protein DDI_2335 [Dickeya dianthicola RNS04.9]
MLILLNIDKGFYHRRRLCDTPRNNFATLLTTIYCVLTTRQRR